MLQFQFLVIGYVEYIVAGRRGLVLLVHTRFEELSAFPCPSHSCSWQTCIAQPARVGVDTIHLQVTLFTYSCHCCHCSPTYRRHCCHRSPIGITAVTVHLRASLLSLFTYVQASLLSPFTYWHHCCHRSPTGVTVVTVYLRSSLFTYRHHCCHCVPTGVTAVPVHCRA